MNSSYLLSILDLYLLKENNGSLIIEVLKEEELIKVDFCYSTSKNQKTFLKLDKKVFFDSLKLFLSKVQGNFQVVDETLLETNKQKSYTITFDNNRKLTFINFSVEEFEMIRSNLSNLESEFQFEKVQEEQELSYTEKFNLSKNLSFSMGFSTYLTLFISAIWFLDIFMISLWIFKAFIK